MTKATPNYHHGIEYIRLSTLPLMQYQEFARWISPLSIFHLDFDNEVHEDCVSFGEYEYWYELNAKETFSELKYSF